MHDEDNSTMKICVLTDQDQEAYRAFLISQEDALFEHSLEVKQLVEKYFHFKPMYLIAEDQSGKMVGALPLFQANSIIEGTRFVSIPFFPFGGVLGTTEEVKRALLEQAKEISHPGRFLQVRQRDALQLETVSGLVLQTPITDFLLDLKGSEQEMFSSLDKSVRYDIRKAQKNNLKVTIGTGKKELDDFYDVYLYTRKKRGVPAWPYGLFADALRDCSAAVALTYLQEKPIAAAFLFFHKKEIEYAFAGTDYRYASLCPYYILIWEIIRYGLAEGYNVLDLGGSTKEMNDGQMILFKKRWATRTRPIPYYFYAQDPKNIPQLTGSFALYRLYGKVWSLLPRKVIQWISPMVIRQFI